MKKLEVHTRRADGVKVIALPIPCGPLKMRAARAELARIRSLGAEAMLAFGRRELKMALEGRY